MKAFLSKLVYLLPIFLFLVFTNYTVDPANLFSAKSSYQSNVSYEQKIVNYLLEGYNVTNLNTYEERTLNKLFIESQINNPQVAILGSSRSQLISQKMLEPKSLINNSVTGATIEDILAIYNLYEINSVSINEITLEISPWMLNDNNQQSRWSILEEEYNSFLEKLNQADQNKNTILIHSKYLELISFEYFQESIYYLMNKKEIIDPFLFKDTSFNKEFPLDSLYYAVLHSEFSYQPINEESKINYLNRVLKKEDFYNQWKSLNGDIELLEEDQNLIDETLVKQDDNTENSTFQENIIKRNRKLLEFTFWEFCPISEEPSTYKTTTIDNTGLTILPDGTFSYPENFRMRTQQQIDMSASTFANNIFGLSNFTDISKSKTVLIEKFISYLTAHEIEVNILLLPYHPEVYKKIEKEYPMVIEAEKTIVQIAKNNGVNCHGSYNPSKTRTTNNSFYDGMHLKPLEIEKILKLKTYE